MASKSRPAIPTINFLKLLETRFQANPEYHLVAHSELNAEQRYAFRELKTDPDHFGLLVPGQSNSFGVKSINHDVAKLFNALQSPSRIPAALPKYFVSTENDHDLCTHLASLVLDGILEMESDKEYICGPLARNLIATVNTASVSRSVHSNLSRAALSLALEVPGNDATILSSWLYNYNTTPASPQWLKQIGSDDEMRRKLGLDKHSRNYRALAADYDNNRNHAWDSWFHRSRFDSTDHAHLGYKLYISPHPGVLVEAYDSIVEALVDLGVAAFKLGRGSFGLLRPDKLVVYADDWNSLCQIADRMKKVLGSMTAHGVPFTAPFTDNGLLSWGMDPPPEARLSSLGIEESWRFWTCNKLARAVLNARTARLDKEQSLKYVETRLLIEGIDPQQWLPTATIWNE